MKEYLTSAGIEFDTVKELGGLMNFVWWIKEKSGHSIRIKNAGLIAKDLDKLRFWMDFEAYTIEKIPHYY